MQIPRWAAVAVLAPIGLLMIHASLVSHSPLGRTPIAASAPASTTHPSDHAPVNPSDAPRTDVTFLPVALVPEAARAMRDASDGGAPEAARASSATLPSVMSTDWGNGKFAHFTKDELREMADRCELRWQLPPFSGTTLPTFESADESALYGDVLAKERARYEGALHGLHDELTGDQGPSDLRSLRDALRVHPDADAVSVHRAISGALADGSALPDGIYARYLQAEMAAGDDFERALAGTFGADRAQALRDAAGARHTLTGCDSDNAIYRSER